MMRVEIDHLSVVLKSLAFNIRSQTRNVQLSDNVIETHALDTFPLLFTLLFLGNKCFVFLGDSVAYPPNVDRNSYRFGTQRTFKHDSRFINPQKFHTLGYMQ